MKGQEEDDADAVVEERFSRDPGVQPVRDAEPAQGREDGHRVGGRHDGAEKHGVLQSDRQP